MSTPRFALFGESVARSLSPRIHAAFAAQAGVAMQYHAIATTPTDFPDALAAFVAEGGCGGNVTAPLKADAAALCRELSPAASRAGVVNTLVTLRGGGFRGDNTDGAGFVADLERRHGHELRGRRVLVVGAGGAVAGVLPALLDAGVARVALVNRTPERAAQLAARSDDARVEAFPWAALADRGQFDLVINGTSAAVRDEPIRLPATLVAAHTIACDLNYGVAAHGFLAWANAAGAAATHDGLGMLVEQAAIAFSRWHGVMPATDPVYAQLRGDG